MLLRIPDGAAGRDATASHFSMLSTRLGFWSFEPDEGTVTCDVVAAEICGIAGPCTCPVAHLLGRIESTDRRSILRAGLRSMHSTGVFDLVALIQTPRGARKIRVIGGRGYRQGCVTSQLHGVVEQVPGGVRFSINIPHEST